MFLRNVIYLEKLWAFCVRFSLIENGVYIYNAAFGNTNAIRKCKDIRCKNNRSES